jgi:hypothetical protein
MELGREEYAVSKADDETTTSEQILAVLKQMNEKLSAKPEAVSVAMQTENPWNFKQLNNILSLDLIDRSKRQPSKTHSRKSYGSSVKSFNSQYFTPSGETPAKVSTKTADIASNSDSECDIPPDNKSGSVSIGPSARTSSRDSVSESDTRSGNISEYGSETNSASNCMSWYFFLFC